MDGDGFSCDNFQPQKWRKDVCRHCYQPLRVHGKKPETSPTSPGGGAGGGKEAKVFQRFRVNKERGIDRSVSARDRTPVKDNLEGISAGKVAGVVGGAPVNQVKSPSPSSPAENSVSALPKPKPPPVSPSYRGVKVPSRPPPPVSAIHKPSPPATVSTTRGPLSLTKVPSPTPPTTAVVVETNTTQQQQQLALNAENGSNSDSNELKGEVKKADISTDEMKEEELKLIPSEDKAKEKEDLVTNNLPSKVSESLDVEGNVSDTWSESRGDGVGGAMERGEEEIVVKEKEKEEFTKEKREGVTGGGAKVEEVMEVVEMTNSSTKLESLFSDSRESTGEGEGTEGGENEPSDILATGEEGVEGGEEAVGPEVVNEMSEVVEMEREEGEDVGASLKFAANQLTEAEEARRDVVVELSENGVDASGGDQDKGLMEEEEEEEEGTDGVLKSLKKKLSIKKNTEKAGDRHN